MSVTNSSENIDRYSLIRGAMEGYSKRSFRAVMPDGYAIAHDVYTQGSGPVVMILQELPGIVPATLQLAKRFVASGFTVVLPHLLGPLGKSNILGNSLRLLCLRREFHLFATGRSSPIVHWLRALCQDVKQLHQVEGIGVLGMCLTGNFAISLMVDEAVLAAVASQPSMPFFEQGALHMSSQDIQQVCQRLDTLKGSEDNVSEAELTRGDLLAYRFEGDWICQAEKFRQLDRVFNQSDSQAVSPCDRKRIHLRTLPGRGHSVFTLHFVDADGHPTHEALTEVLSYFHRTLVSP